MNINRITSALLIFTTVSTLSISQNFLNGDLNGIISGVSSLPSNWQNVPFTDVNCQATASGQDTPDLTNLTGPDAQMGLLGNPYSGSTFVSGLHSGQTGAYWHEGIMQTVSGLTIGQVYNIRFHQSVVKQKNAIDTSGSWSVYINNTLAGTTPPTKSAAAFNSTSFTWETENISFTATATSHLIKFLPMDDDANHLLDSLDAGAALRMGIDSISLSSAMGINDISYSMAVSISPNPANSNFTVETNFQGAQTVELLDINGKIVFKQNFSEKINIDSGIFDGGIYTLSIILGDQRVNKKLVIIR